MSDDLVTHTEVLKWLPHDVKKGLAEAERARELALPPEERGWATADEVANLPGQWIAVQELSEPEPRYLPGRRA